MMFVEMSRTKLHGGAGWQFTKCLWSPTRKRSNVEGRQGTRWPYWDLLLKVKKGDTILHLQGVHPRADFVGFSKAATDGYLTRARPPEPEEWRYADEHYRVDLEEFVRLPKSVNLAALFESREAALTAYFHTNKGLKRRAKRLFYVEQSRKGKKRLQCLNGAYLSELDEQLFEILFPELSLSGNTTQLPPIVSVETAEQLRLIKVREGHAKFSGEIKLQYGNRCCFPGCDVRDPRFLVGAHIARWSDNPTLRGQMGNGLCLCVFHDKAFEIGLFTLDRRFNVHVNQRELAVPTSLAHALEMAQGLPINLGPNPPIEAALREHWRRTGCQPPDA